MNNPGIPQRHPPTLAREPRRPQHCLIDVTGLGDRDLCEGGTGRVEKVVREFAFRSNDYYMGLIDRHDPNDPIARLVLPRADELTQFGNEDPSDEASNTRLAGLQHKYPDTAVLLVTDQCAGFCRYCFRKRLFTPGSRETQRDCRPALDYIGEHHEITDVLVSGGDPLTLTAFRLAEILDALHSIPHLRTIRIGSKVPAFDPFRIIDDRELQEVLQRVADGGKTLYVMTHFDHPRELTPEARESIRVIRRSGALCANQCPIITGVNDDADTLAALFQACTETGCPQYYVFQCRPTLGNASFVVPITRALETVEAARARVSGLSRRARYCISHASGKVEVVGSSRDHIYARYHRARDDADTGRFVIYHRNDAALWLDDLIEVD